MSLRRLLAPPRLVAVALLAAMASLAGPAGAQVCGDANGDDIVNVIDSANVARAAVGLPSACDTNGPPCDPDGNGIINVIDSANVARAAVGLPSAMSCPFGPTPTATPGPGGPEDTALLLRRVQAFIEEVLGRIPIGSEQVSNEPCDNVEDEGIIEAESDPETGIGFDYDTCVLDGVEFCGLLDVADNLACFSAFFLTGPDEDQTDFSSENVDSVTLNDTGNSLVVNGTVEITFSPSDDNPGICIFQTYSNLTLPREGLVTSGSYLLEVDDEEGLGSPPAATIMVTYDGTTSAAVEITFTDQTTGTFVFDTATGTLTEP